MAAGASGAVGGRRNGDHAGARDPGPHGGGARCFAEARVGTRPAVRALGAILHPRLSAGVSGAVVGGPSSLPGQSLRTRGIPPRSVAGRRVAAPAATDRGADIFGLLSITAECSRWPKSPDFGPPVFH